MINIDAKEHSKEEYQLSVIYKIMDDYAKGFGYSPSDYREEILKVLKMK